MTILCNLFFLQIWKNKDFFILYIPFKTFYDILAASVTEVGQNNMNIYFKTCHTSTAQYRFAIYHVPSDGGRGCMTLA